MAADWNVHIPFWVAAGTEVVAICVLASGHSLLTRAESTRSEPASEQEPAEPRERPVRQ
jgi:hypothetical protein